MPRNVGPRSRCRHRQAWGPAAGTRDTAAAKRCRNSFARSWRRAFGAPSLSDSKSQPQSRKAAPPELHPFLRAIVPFRKTLHIGLSHSRFLRTKNPRTGKTVAVIVSVLRLRIRKRHEKFMRAGD